MELLQEGTALLRHVDNPYELAHLLCVKPRTALDAGNGVLAHTALREADEIARRISATSDSGLARDIDALREAVVHAVKIIESACERPLPGTG